MEIEHDVDEEDDINEAIYHQHRHVVHCLALQHITTSIHTNKHIHKLSKPSFILFTIIIIMPDNFKVAQNFTSSLAYNDSDECLATQFKARLST